MPLFEIDSQQQKLVPFSPVRGGLTFYEDELETLVWGNSDEFVGESLFLVARRPKVPGGGFPDIVALDRQAHVVVVEIKREIDRGQLAQGLEYAGWARTANLDQLSGMYHAGQEQFWTDWQRFTESDSPVSVSQPPQLYLIARSFYGRTEEAYEFLSENDLPVHLIRASLHEDVQKKRRFVIVDTKERRGPLGSRFTVADLLENELLSVGQELVWHQPKLGVTHRARLKDNGELELEDGRVFSSPSGAAQAVASRPVNGWAAWKAGDVSLDDLRKCLAVRLESAADGGELAGSEKPAPSV